KLQDGIAGIGVESQEAREETQASFDQVIDGAEKGGKAAESAGHHLGGMRRIISAIHHESPLMGEALHAALHPATAGFIALLTVIKLVHKAFEDYDKYLESIKIVDLSPLTGSVEKQKASLSESKTAAALYAQELQRLADKQDTVTDKTNKAIDAIKRQEQGLKAISSAEEARALAHIEADIKTGKISEEEGIKRRLAIQKAGITERTALENKAAQDTLTARENQYKQLEEDAKKHAETVKELEEKTAKEKVEIERIKGRVTIKETTEKINEARENYIKAAEDLTDRREALLK